MVAPDIRSGKQRDVLDRMSISSSNNNNKLPTAVTATDKEEMIGARRRCRSSLSSSAASSRSLASRASAALTSAWSRLSKGKPMPQTTPHSKTSNSSADNGSSSPGASFEAIKRRHAARLTDVDGLYAWFILACVFVLNTTTLGALKVYGLIYERMVRLDYYSREDASWPIATASTIQNFAGLLTPTLTKYMSWRQVELLQTSMFVASNLGAYFSDNLYLDILCLGILQGVAFSLRYNMNIVINNEYFQQYRTTAMGISMAGSTCGVFFLSPLVSYALDLDTNQFRLAYLALAIIMASNYIFNMFIRPPRSVSEAATSSKERCRLQIDDCRSTIELSGKSSTHGSCQTTLNEHETIKTETLATFKQDREASSGGTARCLGSTAVPVAGMRTAKGTGDSAVREGDNRQCATNNNINNNKRDLERTVDDSCHGRTQLQLSAEQVEYLKEVGMPRAKGQEGHEEEEGQSYNNIDAAHGNNNNGCQRRRVSASFADMSWRDMILKLTGNPFFHCIWIMQTIYFYISRTYTIILVDLAIDMGFSTIEARSLLHYWVYGELLGRILLGPLVDSNILSIKYCTIFTCALTGASSFLLIAQWLHNQYVWYCVVTMLLAAFTSLIAMLIVPFAQCYLHTRQQVPWAYAMGAFISSLFLLVRPKLIGYSRDTLRSYNLLIIIMASAPIIYAILLFLLEPLLRKLMQRNDDDSRT